MLPEPIPTWSPPAVDHTVQSNKSPCGHGRAPKDRRGNRDQRLRGRIKASLYAAAGLRGGWLEVAN